MRRNDVASTSFRRRVPTKFLINQCQIITFLILKYDIENSRIELRGIVLPVQVGGLLGGQRVCWPHPSQIIGGWASPPPPPPHPPSSYAYATFIDFHLYYGMIKTKCAVHTKPMQSCKNSHLAVYSIAHEKATCENVKEPLQPVHTHIYICLRYFSN